MIIRSVTKLNQEWVWGLIQFTNKNFLLKNRSEIGGKLVKLIKFYLLLFSFLVFLIFSWFLIPKSYPFKILKNINYINYEPKFNIKINHEMSFN